MSITDDIKTERFYLLFALYIASEADYDHALNLNQLAENRGLKPNKFRKIWKYFMEENFITPKDGGLEYLASITHRGVKAVEEVFLDQYKQTYYFPSFREMMR
jgi:ssDNA-specific exonuclease RecJ